MLRNVGFTIFSLIYSASSIAASNGKDYFSLSLEELINVTIASASLRNQSTVKAPSKVHVISSQSIKDRNYRYLSDVLKDLSAVRLSLYSASPDSGSSEIIVRGIQGNNKVVLMWNGQRLNHPDSQPLHITPYLYPLNGIDQIEIIYGSASALYGSDTVSMTINMISSVSSDKEEPTWRAGIDYGRNNEKNGFILYSGAIGKIKSQFLFNTCQTDGINFSKFEQFYSRYPLESGINASFTYFPPEERAKYYNPSEESVTARAQLEMGNTSLQVYYQKMQTQSQIGWSPLIYEANSSSGQYIFEQAGFYLTHKFELINNIFLESMIEHTRNQLDSGSHWNRPNAAPFRVYSASLKPRGDGTRTFKLNYGNRTKIEERVSWGSPENNLHSVIGFSFTTVDMLPKTANLDFPLSYSDSFSNQITDTQKFHNLTENNVGVYAQGQYDASNKLTLTIGGRLDIHSRYGSTFNPRLVANYYDEKTSWFVKGIIGSSYLAPAAFFIFDTFLVPRTSQQVPNTDLAPEKTISLDLNFGKNFDNYVIEASIFHTVVDNLIMQRQVKSVEQLNDELGDYTFTTTHAINSGETDISGFTLEAKGQIGNHILPYASYTYLTGKITDKTNNELPYDLIHAPKNQAKLGFDTKWMDNALTLYFEALFTGKANYHPNNYRFPSSDNNGRQFKMDSFWVLGMGGSYQINQQLLVSFDISNLTDQIYDQPIVGQETSDWTRIAATPGIPRQFYLGFSWAF